MDTKPPLWPSFEIQQLIRTLTGVQGVMLDDLLADTKVTPQDLENPAFRLTLDQELKLYTRIAHHNTDPTLAICNGKSHGLSRFGLLGQAMLGASTVHEALKLAVQFMPLISWSCNISLAYEKPSVKNNIEENCFSLRVAPTLTDQKVVELEAESMVASLHTVLNEIVMEKVFFQAIYFAHPNRADNDDSYRELFQCPVTFSAGANKIILSEALMSRQLPYAKPEQAELIQELCGNMVRSLLDDYSIAATLKKHLQENIEELPSLESAAQHFNLSSRTLRRRLTDVKTSYQSIVDEVRFSEARRQLEQSTSSIDAISLALGYKDVRGFRIAFKRWAGMTPSDFREQKRPSTRSE